MVYNDSDSGTVAMGEGRQVGAPGHFVRHSRESFLAPDSDGAHRPAVESRGRRDGRPGARERSRRARGDALPVGSAATGNLTAEPYRYTMADLEAETGISARTIRYYITEGLLPAAKGRGVGATYSPTHLLRLKAIAAMRENHTPLAEIRQRLEGIREADLAAMLHVETAPPEDRWRRVHLHPDLELHVRERGGRDRNYALEKVVDMIVRQSEVLIDRELGDSR